MLSLLPGASAATDPPRYRIVSGFDAEEIQSGLREIAGQGYHVVSAAVGPNFRGWTGSCREVHLLLERRPDIDAPSEYVVIDGGYLLLLGGLEKMNEAGSCGFQVLSQGVIVRYCHHYSILGSGTTREILVIMGMVDPEARTEYVTERFRTSSRVGTLNPWPALAARIADGFFLVGFTPDGAVLARRERAHEEDGVGAREFLVVDCRRKKLTEALEAAVAERFRLGETPMFGNGTGNWLLERNSEAPEHVEYRLLPNEPKALAFMNASGAEGFRLHPSGRPIMERGSVVDRIYEYRVIDFRSGNDLVEAMGARAGEGWSIVSFRADPKKRFVALLERSSDVEALVSGLRR